MSQMVYVADNIYAGWGQKNTDRSVEFIIMLQSYIVRDLLDMEDVCVSAWPQSVHMFIYVCVCVFVCKKGYVVYMFGNLWYIYIVYLCGVCESVWF